MSKRQFPWRKKNRPKYEIIISEILLQRTKAETVNKHYSTFIKLFPSWKTLSKARKPQLTRIIKPLGLWRQRTQVLSNLSLIAIRTGGKFPSSRKHLETLPGIGQYIANAILLICYNKREPLLDVNMARLLERFFGPRKLSDIRYDPYLQNLSRSILPMRHFREFNWAILDFASIVCKRINPMHKDCPLRKRCYFWIKHFNN